MNLNNSIVFFGRVPGNARFLRVKVSNPSCSGKDIVKDKGVHRKVRSDKKLDVGNLLKVAVYVRLGNSDQLTGRYQAEVLTKQNWGMWGDRTEIDIYDDTGVSRLQATRSGLQKLLQKAGTYNGVFVSSMDRVSRSVPDAARLARQLKDSGAEFYAPDGNMVVIAEKIMEAITNNFYLTLTNH